jgi:hypothetical protein
MQFDRALYDAVVQDFEDSRLNAHGDVPMFQNFGARAQAHALVLAYLSTNPSLIKDPQPLWHSRLLVRANESCATYSDLYHGTISKIQVTKFRAPYQYFASAGIMVWGLILLVAALPYRGRVLRGSLDQWMSFGADVGLEDMVGASSGRTSAVSDRIWMLRASEVGDCEHTLGLEAYNGKGSTQPLKLKFGERYI